MDGWLVGWSWCILPRLFFVGWHFWWMIFMRMANGMIMMMMMRRIILTISYYYVFWFFLTRHLGGWFHLGARLLHNLEHQFQLVDVYDFYKMCPIHGTLAPITSQLVVVANSFLQGFIHHKWRMSSMNSSWISHLRRLWEDWRFWVPLLPEFTPDKWRIRPTDDPRLASSESCRTLSTPKQLSSVSGIAFRIPKPKVPPVTNDYKKIRRPLNLKHHEFSPHESLTVRRLGVKTSAAVVSIGNHPNRKHRLGRIKLWLYRCSFAVHIMTSQFSQRGGGDSHQPSDSKIVLGM